MTLQGIVMELHTPTQPVPKSGVVWSDDRSIASFQTDLSVSLNDLGTNTANRDLVRIAVAVFLADRAFRRPRSWRRDIKVAVPVEKKRPWEAALGDLERLLGFLTGDRWQIELVSVKLDLPSATPSHSDFEQYMLLSGGADSLSGALTLATADQTCFVSRTDAGQPAARRQLQRLWSADVSCVSRIVSPRSSATRGLVGREPTSRSRSLLFFALGLLIASTKEAPLLVPENGFASLNVPLVPERTGSHSTRTTHPRYIHQLRGILEAVGAHADLSNPYAGYTKGEMFNAVAKKWGSQEASAALSASISCAKRSGLRVPKPEGTNHCGLCYGCLVRRAAFNAAGLTDQTLYYANPRDEVGEPGRWHTAAQRVDISAFQFAVAAANRPTGAADIRANLAATRLPSGSSYGDAVDLVKRGLDEIAQILP